MSYGWNERPTKATVRHFEGNADGSVVATIYEIGKYQVRVPGSQVEVTYTVPGGYRDSNPRQTLPNMEITDGEVRIPITDFVEEILTRLSPVDLAKSLWENQEVRDEFMVCLVESFGSFSDADRRKFLHEVKEAVHSKAIDTLHNKMSSIEYDLSKRSFFYHQINDINAMLHDNECKRFDGTPIRLGHEDNDPVFKIGGTNWNEARDFWRQRVEELFPGPEEPVVVEPPPTTLTHVALVYDPPDPNCKIVEPYDGSPRDDILF
jgi:hypothetical protein